MKKNWIRLVCIGICHIVLYMYLVPFVIYPRYGDNGKIFATILGIVIVVAVLGTARLGKKKTHLGDKDDKSRS